MEPLMGDSVRALPSGRIPLYVCSLCGDLGCGALCVRMTMDGDTVTWSDFCLENDHEPFDEPDPDFVEVPVIRFGATDYVMTVRRALSR
jgi:hypothetical protein